MRIVLTVLTAFLTSLISCKSVPKNRNDAYIPAALQCPTDTDPNCIGGSTAAIQVPIAPPPAAPSERAAKPKVNRFVSGRCELIVTGENKVLPCDGLRLVVRSTRDNEERVAKFDGYGFRIDDLREDENYRIEAKADKYEVTTDTKTLRPGQKQKIRVMAKPRL